MNPPAYPLFQQRWPEGEYRFFQLGFVVDDLLATAARWISVYGVGPFHVLPAMTQPWTYRGAAIELTTQIAVAQAGPVQIELIQQNGDTPSVFRELERSNPSGFHQLCSVTRDYDATKAHYEGLGYELATEVTAQGGRVGYFDTLADFGFYTEVAEETPGFAAALAGIATTCAAWDGTDPIRLLTRDGYRVP